MLEARKVTLTDALENATVVSYKDNGTPVKLITFLYRDGDKKLQSIEVFTSQFSDKDEICAAVIEGYGSKPCLYYTFDMVGLLSFVDKIYYEK